MSTRAAEPHIYVMPVVRELPPPWASRRPAETWLGERRSPTAGEEAER